MSRLCVKGLGPGIVEKDLKELFSKKGEVTDVRLMRSKSGKSRQFAFVGFRSDEQAKEAKEYFHNTFVKTSRVIVEMAEKATMGDKKKNKKGKDNELASPSSIKGSAKAKKEGEGEGEKEGEKDGSKSKSNGDDKKEEVSAEQQEFMDMMKSRKEGKFWGNDDSRAPKGSSSSNKKQSGPSAASLLGLEDNSDEEQAADSDSDESYMDVDTGVVAPTADSDSDGDGDGDGDGGDKKTDAAPPSSGKKRSLDAFIAGLEASAPQKEKNKKGKKGKKEEEAEENNEEEEEEEEVGSATGDSAKAVSASASASNTTGNNSSTDPSRLFVKNIPFSCSEGELRDLFGPHGELRSVHIPLDSGTKTSKGFAFVQFVEGAEAAVALDTLDGASFQGRVIRLSMAESSRAVTAGSGVDGGGGGGGGGGGAEEWASTQDRWVKNNKNARKDADSGVANAAYTSSDAVVQSIAANYDVGTNEILDINAKGGDLAVRLAIGETKVIQDNKTYFACHGIDLSALESALSGGRHASKRSGTTMLIKNLPHCQVYDDLERLFANFGELAAFLVPPSKTVALVDFIEPSDARSAFKGLAYRRYQHTPLYLEWAPEGIVDTQKKKKGKEGNQSKQHAGGSNAGALVKDGDATTSSSSSSSSSDKQQGVEEEEDSGAERKSNTIFLRNLAFSCTEAEVLQHLEGLGVGTAKGMRSVIIPKSKSGGGKSPGYCFVEYADAAQAAAAVLKANKSKIGARVIDAETSSRNPGASSSSQKGDDDDGESPSKEKKEKKKRKKEAAEAAAAAGTAAITKLSVRNVAFQATEGELHSLFAAFGAVKRVKLPKKMDGTHRGFAFVEFSTHQEALQAITSLSSTHLYGRHLILQWAKADE